MRVTCRWSSGASGCNRLPCQRIHPREPGAGLSMRAPNSVFKVAERGARCVEPMSARRPSTTTVWHAGGPREAPNRNMRMFSFTRCWLSPNRCTPAAQGSSPRIAAAAAGAPAQDRSGQQRGSSVLLDAAIRVCRRRGRPEHAAQATALTPRRGADGSASPTRLCADSTVQGPASLPTNVNSRCGPAGVAIVMRAPLSRGLRCRALVRRGNAVDMDRAAQPADRGSPLGVPVAGRCRRNACTAMRTKHIGPSTLRQDGQATRCSRARAWQSSKRFTMGLGIGCRAGQSVCPRLSCNARVQEGAAVAGLRPRNTAVVRAWARDRLTRARNKPVASPAPPRNPGRLPCACPDRCRL